MYFTYGIIAIGLNLRAKGQSTTKDVFVKIVIF